METLFKTESYKGAEFSSDRKYRYALWRIWNEEKPPVMIIGLNPSTANESKNDNTIEKVEKVARHNGYGGFYMMNLFGIVSADPAILMTTADPIGENDKWLDTIAKKCGDIVFAWGGFPEAVERGKLMIQRFEVAYCFKQNKNGSPKHPLYCPDLTVFIPFDRKLIVI